MSMNLTLYRTPANSQIANSDSEPAVHQADDAVKLKIFDASETDSDDRQPPPDQSDEIVTALFGAMMAGYNGEEFDAGEIARSDSEGSLLYLEKAWHGLHYLLSGESWGGSGPRAFLLAGGVEQGEDMGYGPARYLTPDEVSDIAQELKTLAPDDFWANFDAQKMNNEGIYPNIWDEPADELQEEYLDYLQELQAFLADAAEAGDGLQIVME